MTDLTTLSRRRFLELTGVASAGLLLCARVGAATVLRDLSDQRGGHILNLFVSVKPDGQVEIIAHRSEMGTGIRSALPQIVADEMGADWDRVSVVQGLADTSYGSQNTDGSRSVRDFYLVMRQMGAAARTMLEQAAATTWAVPVAQCRARDHAVYHSSGKRLEFGALSEAAAAQEVPAVDALKLRDQSEFRYIGKGLPTVDLLDISRGSTTFGIDVRLPDMLYASIERAPSLGAEPGSYDEDAARKIAGVVEVVTIKGHPLPAEYHPLAGVAVVAKDSWSAQRGRQALDVQWRNTEHAKHDSTAYLEALAAKVTGQSGEVARKRGDTEAAFAANKRQLEATYVTPYLAHASMEPPAATAHLHDGVCEVWACTQTPQSAQEEVARALGLKREAVKMHVTLLGGGFGRKSKPDFVVEAALLARAMKRPVQLTWTREDDIRNDYFHSCAAQYYKAALDENNQVVAWLAREAVPPIGSTFELGENLMSDGALSQSYGSLPFDIPNLQLERHEADAHVRIGWLRSVYNIPFAFGIGSFVDELAAEAGVEPVAFWLQLLGDDRLLDFEPEGFKFSNYGRSLADYPYDIGRFKGVLKALDKHTDRSSGSGQGWGVTAIRSFLSYVAVATKVEVRQGRLKVLEMHCVLDCGTVVNPDRVHAQLEGAMIFGLSLALMGEISFSEGVALQSNFHDYPVARINQVPPLIKTHIVPSEALPAGVGEPGVPPVAPSIANAIFAATGQRIRELPFNRQFAI